MKNILTIIALIIAIFLMVIFPVAYITSSCGNNVSVKTPENNRFIAVERMRETTYWGCHDIFYDKYTKVMYVFYKYGYGGGLSPLYNSDGTLMLYTGE